MQNIWLCYEQDTFAEYEYVYIYIYTYIHIYSQVGMPQYQDQDHTRDQSGFHTG